MDFKYKVILSEKASRQIDAIYQYISENLQSDKAAKALMAKIKKNLVYLETAPHIFPLSKIKGCRKCLVDNYLVFFEIDESAKEIHIVAAYHGSQDYLAIFLIEKIA